MKEEKNTTQTGGMLYCSVCDQTFESPEELQEHNRESSGRDEGRSPCRQWFGAAVPPQRQKPGRRAEFQF
jgi:hypothetical protein